VSVVNLQAFLSKVAGDQALRDKLQAAAGVDDIVTLAAAHGHDLDKAAILRAHAETLAQAPDHALSGINSWGDALMHCFGATEAD
jgi:predicted ribosomally synthesized peptide with nif11-like leader